MWIQLGAPMGTHKWGRAFQHKTNPFCQFSIIWGVDNLKPPYQKSPIYIYISKLFSVASFPPPKKKRGNDKSSRMEASFPYNILVLYHTSNIWIIDWLLNPIAINKLSQTHPMYMEAPLYNPIHIYILLWFASGPPGPSLVPQLVDAREK